MGHGIVEFPLLAIIVFGFATMVDLDVVRPFLLLTAGLVLLWMSVGMPWLSCFPARCPSTMNRCRTASILLRT